MPRDAPFVLIVEDMVALREPLGFALRHAGFRVVEAGDGLEALEAIDREKPDIVLLDLAMPRMDGLACLRNIRQVFSRARLPVVILSAHSEQDLVLEAVRLGVDGYLLKSTFSLQELINVVTRITGSPAKPTKDPAVAEETAANPGAGQTECSVEFRRDGSREPSVVSRGPTIVRFASSRRRPDEEGGLRIARSDLVDRLKALSSPKGFRPAITNLLRVIDRPDATLDQIVEAAAVDQALASRLLWVANSAAYARGGPVTSTRTAILRIGTDRIGEIALSLGIMERFGKGPQRLLHYGRFWEHSVAVATFAAEIVHRSPAAAKHLPADVAFTIGLLHDIGRLILAEEFEREYEEILQLATERRVPLFELESRLLPMTHAAVAEWLLLDRRFSREAVRPIAQHHLPWSQVTSQRMEERLPVAVTMLADGLAHALQLGESGNETLREVREAAEIVGLSEEDIPELARTVTENWRDVRSAVVLSAGHSWEDRLTKLHTQLGEGVAPRILPGKGRWSGLDLFLERLFPQGGTFFNCWITRIPGPDSLSVVLQEVERLEEEEGLASLGLVALVEEDGAVPDVSKLRRRVIAVVPKPTQISSFLQAVQVCAGP